MSCSDARASTLMGITDVTCVSGTFSGRETCMTLPAVGSINGIGSFCRSCSNFSSPKENSPVASHLASMFLFVNVLVLVELRSGSHYAMA